MSRNLQSEAKKHSKGVTTCANRYLHQLIFMILYLICQLISRFIRCGESKYKKMIVDDMKTENKKEKVSEWTFWNIYINYGLKGSLLKLFILSPVVLGLIICEFTINAVNTYTTTVVTKTLTQMTKQYTTNDTHDLYIDSSAIPEMEMSMMCFAMLLLGVLFASDLSNFINRMARPRSSIYKTQIIQRIETKVWEHMQKASHETDKEHGIGDKFEALNRFMWVYDSITDTIIDASVQTTRSLALCLYIIYQEPLVSVVLMIVYTVIWRHINNINNTKKSSECGQKFWERAYYDLSNQGITKINPLYDQLYRKDDVRNETANGVIDIENIQTIEMNFTKNDAIIRPNVVDRYMETIRYYSAKHAKYGDSYDFLQIAQNSIICLILVAMFYTGRYETAIVILINRHTVFSMINTFSNLKRLEKNAERSMEPVTKILEAVDNQINTHMIQGICEPKQLIDTTKEGFRRRIKSVDINQMKTVIPAQKSLKRENKQSNDQDLETDSQNPHPIKHDRHVLLESGHIDYKVGKCLLLEGVTGCGKSVTINAIAGLYTRGICRDMQVNWTDDTHTDGEFNQLLGSRCYVSQMLSDEFKFNGKITLPMFKLFPGAKSIEEITRFLVDVMALKYESIPESLTDHPHSKLSGGELQRFVVATQIWRTLRLKPDMLILDEVDRALDKETAVRVMRWIVTNVECFFVIVTHLSEVKQMLLEKGCVSQIWNYQIPDSDIHQIKIVARHV